LGSVSNAIKFTDTGSITVTLHQKCDEKLDVMVSDTGIGMTEQEQRSLFRQFSQVSQRRSHHDGSGLGLYITKHIVRLLGGTIQVTSRKNEGTSFSFSIKTNNVAFSSTQSQSADYRNFNQTNIQCHALIVDDNAINTKVLGHFLRLKGVTYDTASSGEEALTMLQDMRIYYYSIIFMDINMKGISGIETTKKIRQREEELGFTKKSVIVCVSGYTRDEYKVCAQNAGMNTYLSKPYTKQDIFAIIDKWC
jgi:CheY-like chemotaxis protein